MSPVRSTLRPWTAQEVTTLREMRVMGSIRSEIADRLARSVSEVDRKLAELGLSSRQKNPAFTDDEDTAIAEAQARGEAAWQVAERLGRSPAAVRKRGASIGAPFTAGQGRSRRPDAAPAVPAPAAGATPGITEEAAFRARCAAGNLRFTRAMFAAGYRPFQRGEDGNPLRLMWTDKGAIADPRAEVRP